MGKEQGKEYKYAQVIDGSIVAAFTEQEFHNEDRTSAIGQFVRLAPASAKRFHRSDTLTYEYAMIEVGTNKFKREGHEPNIDRVLRCSVKVFAGKHIHWSTIASEVTSLRGRIDVKNPVLATCLVEYDDFVVGLTYNGFMKALEQMPTFGQYSFEEQIEHTAKTLVQMRDWEKWQDTILSVRQKYGEKAQTQQKKFIDFYPRD